jgi:CheY-like chemotaxis protein
LGRCRPRTLGVLARFATLQGVLSRTNRRLLLVEDDPALQQIMGSVLRDAGHDVDVVGDADQAMDRLRREPAIELVVVDKNLPGRDGLSLLAAIRSDEREGRVAGPIAVVLVTGYPSRDSALVALAHDADGYLVKPFISLSRAVQQTLAVLDGDLLTRRAGPLRARRVADSLAGLPVRLDDILIGVVAGSHTTATERLLRDAGARLLPAMTVERADVVVVHQIDEVRRVFDLRRGPAFVLLDGHASFKDLIEVMRCGGGAVVDPSLVAWRS